MNRTMNAMDKAMKRRITNPNKMFKMNSKFSQPSEQDNSIPKNPSQYSFGPVEVKLDSRGGMNTHSSSKGFMMRGVSESPNTRGK